MTFLFNIQFKALASQMFFEVFTVRVSKSLIYILIFWLKSWCFPQSSVNAVDLQDIRNINSLGNMRK